MQEPGLPEATARYQMLRALEDEDGIVKNFGSKFYLDEEKFKAVIEDCRYFEKMDETLGQVIDLKQQLEERGVKVD